jgi:hypothetical protein
MERLIVDSSGLKTAIDKIGTECVAMLEGRNIRRGDHTGGRSLMQSRDIVALEPERFGSCRSILCDLKMETERIPQIALRTFPFESTIQIQPRRAGIK